MRTAFLASLAVTATLSSAFAPSIADACGGGYQMDLGPQVFAVDTHSAIVEGTERWQRRSFVMLGPIKVSTTSWRQLAPETFDPTQIANETTTKASTTMTLVGPSGTQVVSSQRRALLTQGWGGIDGFTALEVATGEDSQFRIAVAGTQPDAKWINVTESKTRGSTAAWLEAQGVKSTSIYSSVVDDTYVQIISAYQDGQKGLTSFVRIGNRSLGRYTGNAIGALDLGGKRYVLFENNGLITPAPV